MGASRSRLASIAIRKSTLRRHGPARRRSTWAVLLAGSASLALIPTAAASAKTFHVNTTADHAPGGCTAGDCTLREAVIAANNKPGHDEIVLTPGKRYLLTRAPTANENAALDGDLDVTGSVTISSPGPKRATVDGNHLDAVFQLYDPAAVAFVRIAIRDGNGTAADSAAGIDRVGIPSTPEGRLSLIHSKVSGNTGPYAGGIANFGPIIIRHTTISGNDGISVSGSGGVEAYDFPVKIDHSVIAHNTSGGTGGLYLAGGGTISRSSIERNHSTGGGGVAGVDGSQSLFVTRTKIRRNVGDYDGGVYMGGGSSLAMTRSVVADNTGSGDVGGIDAGANAFQVVRSSISGNHGAYDGGIYLNLTNPGTISRSSITGNVGTLGSGGINSGDLTISNSTVAANHGGGDGGGIYSDGVLTIRGTTISGNHAGGSGGGVLKELNNPGSLTNSTVTGNRADANGGGVATGPTGSETFTLNAVTIARNRASVHGGGGAGGGIFVDAGSLSLTNTLVALNALGPAGVDPNCHGAVLSAGHNLRSTDDPGCTGFAGPGDRVKANPKLGSLADNGGPTKTIALHRHSPAINRADPATAPKHDQRGVHRGKRPDIGAYERH